MQTATYCPSPADGDLAHSSRLDAARPSPLNVPRLSSTIERRRPPTPTLRMLPTASRCRMLTGPPHLATNHLAPRISIDADRSPRPHAHHPTLHATAHHRISRFACPQEHASRRNPALAALRRMLRVRHRPTLRSPRSQLTTTCSGRSPLALRSRPPPSGRAAHCDALRRVPQAKQRTPTRRRRRARPHQDAQPTSNPSSPLGAGHRRNALSTRAFQPPDRVPTDSRT